MSSTSDVHKNWLETLKQYKVMNMHSMKNDIRSCDSGENIVQSDSPFNS
jgi:hypothetical protein